MGLLTLSDLVVGFTLLANAAAVLNYKLPEGPDASPVTELVHHLRFFRGFLGAWNVLVLVCMVLLFS